MKLMSHHPGQFGRGLGMIEVIAGEVIQRRKPVAAEGTGFRQPVLLICKLIL
jgi:hypothetical protein